jgi:hypothetical protein
MLSSFPFSAYGKYSDLSTLEECNQQTPQIKSGQHPLDLAAAPNTLNSTDRSSHFVAQFEGLNISNHDDLPSFGRRGPEQADRTITTINYALVQQHFLSPTALCDLINIEQGSMLPVPKVSL